MITILSKASLNEKQISDRVSRGSRYMELALASETDENTVDGLYYLAKETGLLKSIDVMSVHAPSNKIDCLIEHPRCHERIEKTCYLAEMLSQEYSHSTVVVVHTSTNAEAMKNLGIYDRTMDFLLEQLTQCPDISIGVESHSEFEYNSSIPSLAFNSSAIITDGESHLGCISIANSVDDKRIHPVIDTCHVAMIQDHIAFTGKFLDDKNIESVGKGFTVNAFLESQDKIRHIHLARAYKDGYGKDKHGLQFIPTYTKHTDLLREYADLLERTSFTGNVVLEISENDYNKAEGYTNTLKALETELGLHNLEYRR